MKLINLYADKKYFLKQYKCFNKIFISVLIVMCIVSAILSYSGFKAHQYVNYLIIISVILSLGLILFYHFKHYDVKIINLDKYFYKPYSEFIHSFAHSELNILQYSFTEIFLLILGVILIAPYLGEYITKMFLIDNNDIKKSIIDSFFSNDLFILIVLILFLIITLMSLIEYMQVKNTKIKKDKFEWTEIDSSFKFDDDDIYKTIKFYRISNFFYRILILLLFLSIPISNYLISDSKEIIPFVSNLERISVTFVSLILLYKFSSFHLTNTEIFEFFTKLYGKIFGITGRSTTRQK